MALLARGVFPVPLDPRLTTHERTRVLDGVRPDLVIDSPDAAADLLATLDPSPGPTAHRSLPRARPMHVTSGTTGTPKGVYSGLLDADAAAALVAEERDLRAFSAGGRNLGPTNRKVG